MADLQAQSHLCLQPLSDYHGAGAVCLQHGNHSSDCSAPHQSHRFFFFHDLFIYYILQPFTKDMDVSNPLYKFLSWALYWVAYLNSKLGLGSHLYILLISLDMIAYVSISYWILLKKAPQTFRLKL